MKNTFLRRYRVVLMALPLLFAPVWEYTQRAGEVEGFVEGTGTVVDHVKYRMRSGFNIYAAVIEYQDSNGRKYRLQDPVKSQITEAIGRQVPLLVHPRNPARFVRNELLGHWARPVVIATICGVFFLMVCGMTYLHLNALGRRRSGQPRRPRSRHPA